jgi:hypothetical protein
MNTALCTSRNLNEVQVANESLLDLHIFVDVADVVVVTGIVVGAVGKQTFAWAKKRSTKKAVLFFKLK